MLEPLAAMDDEGARQNCKCAGIGTVYRRYAGAVHASYLSARSITGRRQAVRARQLCTADSLR